MHRRLQQEPLSAGLDQSQVTKGALIGMFGYKDKGQSPRTRSFLKNPSERPRTNLKRMSGFPSETPMLMFRQLAALTPYRRVSGGGWQLVVCKEATSIGVFAFWVISCFLPH